MWKTSTISLFGMIALLILGFAFYYYNSELTQYAHNCTIRMTPVNHETSAFTWDMGEVYHERIGSTDRYLEIFVNAVKKEKVKLKLRIY